MGFLASTESAITNGFTVVANEFGSGLIATFRPMFITGFSIWITLIAYEVAFGKSEDGFTYIFTKIGKMFLIGTIALYGWPELAELLGGIKDGFASGGSIAAMLETNLLDPLAALWSNIFRWFYNALEASAGWTKLGRLFSVIAMFALLFLAYFQLSIVVALFGVVSLAMFLVANSVFVLLLASGPFFLLCLAFPFTQRFFETYIGNVMTSIFAMGFTALMVRFVAGLFGLTDTQNLIPTSVDEAVVSGEIKSLVVYFASKGAMSLLLIYLYYKVFDLAAALGGGLNMGNNMIGGVRAVMRDMQKGSGAAKANQIQQGGGAGAGGGAGGGSGKRGSSEGADRGHSTFTGAALSGYGSAISGTARGTIAIGKAGVRGASAIGRYAYNRYSQRNNRVTAG